MKLRKTENGKKYDRIGSFRVSEKVFNDHPEMLIPVFELGVVVLNLIHFKIVGFHEYIALSPDFDWVEEGSATPLYVVKCHEHEDGKISANFEVQS